MFNSSLEVKEIMNSRKKLRLLLVYSLHPTNKTVTLPEWIKEAIRLYYSEFIEVMACGPENEINIPDSPDFYDKVNQVIHDSKIDLLLDIEGGASSIDFMFKRFPVNITIPKVFWAIDTHQFLTLQKEKAKYFDLVLSAQKNAVKEFPGKSFWMPAGASIYERDNKVNRDIGCAFIGSIVPGLHGKRKEIIDYLKINIPDFQCFSNVFLREKARLSSRIKIMVNQSLRNDLNFRVFESMACGCMLITDKLTDNGLEDIFTERKEIVTFSLKEDLKEKIQYYLSHEKELNEIARKGQEKVLKYFTHEKILKYIFNILFENLLNKKAGNYE
jgi:hypothetical protein